MVLFSCGAPSGPAPYDLPHAWPQQCLNQVAAQRLCAATRVVASLHASKRSEQAAPPQAVATQPVTAHGAAGASGKLSPVDAEEDAEIHRRVGWRGRDGTDRHSRMTWR